jgi:hypothetical protein
LEKERRLDPKEVTNKEKEGWNKERPKKRRK